MRINPTSSSTIRVVWVPLGEIKSSLLSLCQCIGFEKSLGTRKILVNSIVTNMTLGAVKGICYRDWVMISIGFNRIWRHKCMSQKLMRTAFIKPFLLPVLLDELKIFDAYSDNSISSSSEIRLLTKQSPVSDSFSRTVFRRNRNGLANVHLCEEKRAKVVAVQITAQANTAFRLELKINIHLLLAGVHYIPSHLCGACQATRGEGVFSSRTVLCSLGLVVFWNHTSNPLLQMLRLAN